MLIIDCNDKAKHRRGAFCHYCDDLHAYYATTSAGTVLAVKKSGSSVITIHKTSNKTTTTAAHSHIRGVKLLSAHTIPSKIAVGNRFSIGVTVFNNSSATIIFTNGTCTSSPSPLSITFNRNAMIQSQASASCYFL